MFRLIDGSVFRSTGGWLAAGLVLTAPAAATLAAQTLHREPLLPRDTYCACPVSTPARLAATAARYGATSPDGDIVVVATLLANRICTDVSKFSREASTDDLEAAIVYAVSQSEARTPVIAAAFARLDGCDYGYRNFAAALARVRAAMLGRRLQRGTAALGSNYGLGQSSFSAPTVSVGGGSSNYVR